MAKLVVGRGGQQEAMRREHPKPYYSRVISVMAGAPGGVAEGYGSSQGLGQDMWLLGIDVVIQIEPGGALEQCFFDLYRGTEPPKTQQDVENWEKIIDFPKIPGVSGMVARGAHRQFSFKMMRFYSGTGNRFGVVIRNVSTLQGYVYAFFEISEG